MTETHDWRKEHIIRPTKGDTGFQVEWTTDVPVDEYGDSSPDSGVIHAKTFAGEAAAVRFARSVHHLDYWGCVSVTPVVYEEGDYVPGRFRWMPCGESQGIDSPDE